MIRGTDSMDTVLQPPKRRLRGWLLGAGLGALVMGLLLVPGWTRWWGAERSVDARRLRFGTVERGDLERDVAAQGRVVAASFPRLFSPEAGTAELHVRAGDDVAAGALLVTVASPELDAAVGQQRSVFEAARGSLARGRIAAKSAVLAAQQEAARQELRRATAQRELTRMRLLAEQGLANRVELDRAEDELALASIELEHARANAMLATESADVDVRDRELQVQREHLALAELERRRERLSIRSPFAGRVATIEIQDRDAVAADQPVLTVVDLSRFELEVAVPESYADDLEAGTPAMVTWEGREWAAEVVSVSPEVASGQVETRVVFAGEAPRGLRQSQRLPLRIVFDRREAVLRLPRGPFLESGAGRRVWVVEGDLARARSIETGAISVAAVEVTRGLEAGEVVVISDTSLFEGAETVYLRR
jgi:HlyD family secretion protein